MRTLLTLALIGSTAMVAMAEDIKTKKHEASVGFATPNPSWKAKIVEAKIVDKEIWVKVDVATDGGIAPAVIGKAKATAKFEAADLPLKYVVDGKTWKWANKEKEIVFLADLEEKEREKVLKAYKDGKSVYEVKKDDKKDK